MMPSRPAIMVGWLTLTRANKEAHSAGLLFLQVSLAEKVRGPTSGPSLRGDRLVVHLSEVRFGDHPRVSRFIFTDRTHVAASQNHTKPVARSWTATKTLPAAHSQSAVGSAWLKRTPTAQPKSKSAALYRVIRIGWPRVACIFMGNSLCCGFGNIGATCALTSRGLEVAGVV
jgi:hypothetical protein